MRKMRLSALVRIVSFVKHNKLKRNLAKVFQIGWLRESEDPKSRLSGKRQLMGLKKAYLGAEFFTK
jgi:hypothetical protein